MQKSVICAFAALCLATFGANAQNNENFAARPATESTQAVSLDLSIIPLGPNLNYAYEHPLGRLGSIIGRVGVDVGGAWGTDFFGNDYGYWAIAPSIEIEPRFYYGLDRREAHGRSTAGNAGSFLSFNIKNSLPFGYISDSALSLYGATTLNPRWGLRRVWGRGWQFEFTAGMGFVLPWSKDVLYTPGIRIGDHASCYPNVGVKFGYSF